MREKRKYQMLIDYTVGGGQSEGKKVSEVNRLPTQRWEVGGEKSTVSDVNRLPSQRWTV